MKVIELDNYESNKVHQCPKCKRVWSVKDKVDKFDKDLNFLKPHEEERPYLQKLCPYCDDIYIDGKRVKGPAIKINPADIHLVEHEIDEDDLDPDFPDEDFDVEPDFSKSYRLELECPVCRSRDGYDYSQSTKDKLQNMGFREGVEFLMNGDQTLTCKSCKSFVFIDFKQEDDDEDGEVISAYYRADLEYLDQMERIFKLANSKGIEIKEEDVKKLEKMKK